MIFVSLTFISQLKADTLRGTSNFCIEDNYYYAYNPATKKNTFYFYKSSNPTKLLKTTARRESLYLISGYTYDTETGRCKPDTSLLGLSTNQYNFLYGLIGLFFGFLFFWLVPSSKK